MGDLGNASVNLFCSSWQSIPAKSLTLAQALDAIRTGQYRHEIGTLRAILAHDGKPAYDRAKAKLNAFTFAGLFEPSRGNAYLQQHSGLVHGDLDDVGDVEAVKRALADDRRTVYVFISPSANGVKVGVHVPIVDDDAAYKHAWQAVATEYERLYGVRWDPSGKDISRLCYISNDPDLYMNLDAEEFNIPPAPVLEPRPPQGSVSRRDPWYQGYAERAIHTAVQMIEDAELGTRHHTRLRAARLLGGYVAGGLLSDDQAYGALAQALVDHTEDLQRALKTVEDGLAYGKSHPITVDALEAERQDWLAHHGRNNTLQGGLRTIAAAQVLARGSLRTIQAKEVPPWRS